MHIQTLGKGKVGSSEQFATHIAEDHKENTLFPGPKKLRIM